MNKEIIDYNDRVIRPGSWVGWPEILGVGRDRITHRGQVIEVDVDSDDLIVDVGRDMEPVRLESQTERAVGVLERSEVIDLGYHDAFQDWCADKSFTVAAAGEKAIHALESSNDAATATYWFSYAVRVRDLRRSREIADEVLGRTD